MSVCSSVTSVDAVDCIKTAEHIVEILSLPDRPIILVTKGCCIHLTAVALTGVPNTGGGGSDFLPICGYISKDCRRYVQSYY